MEFRMGNEGVNVVVPSVGHVRFIHQFLETDVPRLRKGIFFQERRIRPLSLFLRRTVSGNLTRIVVLPATDYTYN